MDKVIKPARIDAQAETLLPTDHGAFRMVVFVEQGNGKEHIVLIKGDIQNRIPLVRLHSECMTGDIFHSRRCDCGQQLDEALKRMEKDGCGILLYLRQEGRGIGLVNKIKAYQLQELGLDTVEANRALGFADDAREYDAAVEILKQLEIDRVRLLTNNWRKIEALQQSGIQVTEREPIIIESNADNRFYLSTKKEKLGHLF